MKTKAAFLTLVAELDGDLKELKHLAEQNARAWSRIEGGATEPIDWGALGFTLHSLYGILENYFLRVSKFFENNLPTDRWHKVLVDNMRLDIPGIRPALFRTDTEHRQVLELMRFRHRFRNLYGEDLDPQKTAAIQRIANAVLGDFPAIHKNFIHKIIAIADGLP